LLLVDRPSRIDQRVGGSGGASAPHAPRRRSERARAVQELPVEPGIARVRRV